MRRRGEVNPRFHGFLLVVVLILSIWIKGVYDDKSSVESDQVILKIQMCDKDTSIINLSKKVDSLNLVVKKLKTPIIYQIIRKTFISPPKADSLNVDTPIKPINYIDTIRYK